MKFVEFENDGRTFTCEAKSSPATPGTVWWWMSVTGESQRYAAFRAEAEDTQANLRQRILSYYAKLLADRERPREVPGAWARRNAQQRGAAATPAAPEATAAASESSEK